MIDRWKTYPDSLFPLALFPLHRALRDLFHRSEWVLDRSEIILRE